MPVLTYLWIIPLLPLLGAAANGIFGGRWPKKRHLGRRAFLDYAGVSRGARSGARIPFPFSEPDSLDQNLFHLDFRGRISGRLRAAGGPAHRDHAPGRHRRGLADSYLFHGIHARRSGLPPVFFLLESVHVFHARADPGGQLPADVCRLGRRRAVQLPADRLLLPEAIRHQRRQQGVLGEPHRRFRIPSRRAPDFPHLRLARLRDRAAARRRHARRSRRANSARSRRLRFCSSSARPENPRSFRCTSGCRTRWKAPRRSAR